MRVNADKEPLADERKFQQEDGHDKAGGASHP